MSATETVRVTTDHIEQGTPALPDACPIALAIRAQHPEASVDVFNGFALMDRGSLGPMLSASLPLHAVEFIEAFDFDTGAAGPIEFELTWQSVDEVIS